MSSSSANVAIAFGLVIGAGAATALGAVVVFFPALVKHAQRKTLAAALGLSAGVMTYVSFAEIFLKSVDSFAASSVGEDRAQMYATLCFFGGVFVMLTLNRAVTALLGGHHHHSSSPLEEALPDAQKKTKTDFSESRDSNKVRESSSSSSSSSLNDELVTPTPPCCSENPTQDLASIQHMADEMILADTTTNENAGTSAVSPAGSSNGDEEGGGPPDPHEQEKLLRMSIHTALAIALHNFPEGLATFVAALNDPKVGAVLAVAIAIHNIPEGLCVAMPIYYATGNRWKAFAWGVLSGVSEPIAALLGWAVLANVVSDVAYAVLFGLVAGMMVIISVRELLPTAHRYDPEDAVVTNSFILGMAIMALSLVLFNII